MPDDESIETPDSLPELVDPDPLPLRPDPLVWACCGEIHPVLMRINALTPPLMSPI